jgi:hypothetical protein
MTNPAQPTLYWAAGLAVGGLVVADSLDGLVEACIVGYDLTASVAMRTTHRDQWLCEAAADLQQGLIRAGLDDGSFAWSRITDEARARMDASKAEPDSQEAWQESIPLVLVQSSRLPNRVRGPGPILTLDSETPRSFISSLLRAGLLESTGSLTSPSRIEDPTRQPE